MNSVWAIMWGVEGGVAVGGITVQAYLYTVTSAAQFACQCYRGVGKIVSPGATRAEPLRSEA